MCAHDPRQGKKPPFDVMMLVQIRRHQLRQQDDAVKTPGSMSVASRMRFEKLKARIDEATLRARQQQAAFWAELHTLSPSLTKLDDLGSLFNQSVREAETGFEEVLKINPNSTVMLRKYAVFLEEVMNDRLKANRMATMADEYEDALAKEHDNIGLSVTLFAKVKSSCSPFIIGVRHTELRSFDG